MEQPSAAVTEFLPAPEECGRAVVPTAALGTGTALFGGFPPILEVFGESLAALSGGVRVEVSWGRTQRVALSRDGCGPLGTDISGLVFTSLRLAPHPTPGCELISQKNLSHSTEGTSINYQSSPESSCLRGEDKTLSPVVTGRRWHHSKAK